MASCAVGIELGDPAILGLRDAVLELIPETEVQREVLRGAPRVLEETGRSTGCSSRAARSARSTPGVGMPSMSAARLGPMLLAGKTAVVSAARV